jgi:hypothetical protein
MKKLLFVAIISAPFVLTACSNTVFTSAKQSKATSAAQEQLEITTVTEANYPRAETQLLTERYIKKIADATHTDGVGVLWKIREGSDPKDRTIPRTNYDTIYTWAVLDLTEDATLRMPETKGRYQTAWFMTEEHYNPMVFTKPGVYTLTQADMGSRYVVMVIRTQANAMDPQDLKVANAIQDNIQLSQKDKGEYVPQYRWNKKEIIAMRTHFQELAKEKGLTSEVMFGKKGEQSDENHNMGTAVG